MSGYNWQEIFKQKTEKELIQIYSGESSLNFEAEIYAGLELKNRKFDFRIIDQIHHRKINQLQRDLEECKNLKYTNSKYFRNQIIAGAGLLILIYMLINSEIFFSVINNSNQVHAQRDSGKYYEILFYIGLLFITVLSAKWLFVRFKKKKYQNIELKSKLLQKMKDV